jgi:hypothetical protein
MCSRGSSKGKRYNILEIQAMVFIRFFLCLIGIQRANLWPRHYCPNRAISTILTLQIEEFVFPFVPSYPQYEQIGIKQEIQLKQTLSEFQQVK